MADCTCLMFKRKGTCYHTGYRPPRYEPTNRFTLDQLHSSIDRVLSSSQKDQYRGDAIAAMHRFNRSLADPYGDSPRLATPERLDGQGIGSRASSADLRG